MEEKLIALCIEIYAHAELDYEVDLGGRGCNPCEVVGCANVILEILDISRADIMDRIEARISELEEE